MIWLLWALVAFVGITVILFLSVYGLVELLRNMEDEP